MQKDWKRDPIWQLVSVIISVDVTLITQFNDPVLKLTIAAIGLIICGCLFLNGKQIRAWRSKSILQRNSKLMRIIDIIITILAVLVFFPLIIFLCVWLFALGHLWEQIIAVIGGALAFSAGMTLQQRNYRRPFIADVLTNACFVFGIIGIVLMIRIDNLAVKISSGIGMLFAFSISLGDYIAFRNKTSPIGEIMRSLCFFSTILGIILIIVVNNPWGKIAWGVGSIIAAFVIAMLASKNGIFGMRELHSNVPQQNAESLEQEMTLLKRTYRETKDTENS